MRLDLAADRYFYSALKEKYSELIPQYANIYKKDKWGAASREYYNSIEETFLALAARYKIPIRIPRYLYEDILDQNDLIVVILEHLDYILRLKGHTSPYGYAAYSISQLKEPVSIMKGNLRSLKGVGKVTESIIREILRTGTSSYYERMIGFK